MTENQDQASNDAQDAERKCQSDLYYDSATEHTISALRRELSQIWFECKKRPIMSFAGFLMFVSTVNWGYVASFLLSDFFDIASRIFVSLFALVIFLRGFVNSYIFMGLAAATWIGVGVVGLATMPTASDHKVLLVIYSVIQCGLIFSGCLLLTISSSILSFSAGTLMAVRVAAAKRGEVGGPDGRDFDESRANEDEAEKESVAAEPEDVEDEIGSEDSTKPK